jgi:hypothetical protein
VASPHVFKDPQTAARDIYAEAVAGGKEIRHAAGLSAGASKEGKVSATETQVAMLTFGSRTAGNEAQKRAIARTGDTDAEPSFEDKAIGLGSAGAQAALNQIALNKVLSPAKVGVGTSGVTQAARNALTAAATEGATNAAQDAISQGASTAGTKDGLAIDPHTLVDSAILGTVSGGVISTPKSVKDAGSAVRFRDMGGDLTPASAAAANRMIEKAGSVEALQSPSKAFHAVSDTHTDVIHELSEATSTLRKLNPLPVEAGNALARAEKGNTPHGRRLGCNRCPRRRREREGPR